MDGGAWWATVHRVAKSQTRLSDFTFTFAYSTEQPAAKRAPQDTLAQCYKGAQLPYSHHLQSVGQSQRLWGGGARAATVLMCAFPAPGHNPGLYSFLIAALTDYRTLHGLTTPMHHFTLQEATRPTQASLGQSRGVGGAASLLGA